MLSPCCRGLSSELDNWPVLANFLPPGWQEEARKTGALTRARGVPGPEALLRILLIHLANGYSLTETAARAKQTRLADLSAVALFKRLRAAEHWLHWLAKELAAVSGWELPTGSVRYRAVDATVVAEPGSTGTDWRLHYSLTLNDLRCDFFEITDVSGGETWRRIPVLPGDVLLGDRIYGTPTSIAHVLAAKGAVIARVNHHALPLFEANGSAFPMLRRFGTLHVGKAKEWPTFAEHKGQTLRGRLIAVKRTAGATRRVRKRIARKASRKQVNIPQQSWRVAPYFFVWTSLPREFEPSQILKIYRLRWQIELAFKRMKSLLGFGHLPKKDPASARAWLHGKLFVSLLAEHLIAFADELCAGQHEISRERRSRWREVGFMAHEISSSVLPRTDLVSTLDQWTEIASWLGETKRRRARQMLTDVTRQTTQVEK